MANANQLDDKLYERNLKAIQNHLPFVYERLMSHTPTSDLMAVDGKELVVVRNGEKRSARNLRAEAKIKVEQFVKSPQLLDLAIGPPGKNSLDRYGITIANALRECAAADNQTLAPSVTDGERFFLFIFGVGAGLDIQRLVDHFDPTIVVIFEADMDNLVLSLRTFDWHKHLEKQLKRGKNTFLFTDDKPELALANLQSVIQNTCPAAFGGNPCFIFSETPGSTAILEHIRRYAGVILTTLGFMYDETLMLKNTFLNLHDHDTHILVQSEETAFSTPVFVIGAGPSLDADLPFIQANADRAIIVSTGTALRSLLANGITPDFQVEMENIHVYSSIRKLADEFDLSPICLVGSTSIDPHIVKFFKKTLYFYRPLTSPYPLLCTSPAQTLNKAYPLVVNVSFSLAIDIGAEEVYLFGTDFGTRGDGPDHAKDNVVFTEGAMQGYVRDYDTEVPANFNGEFYASKDFISGLKVMHETISGYAKGRRIYNCSDGARIEGATPQRSSNIALHTSTDQKTHDLKSIFERNIIMTQEELGIRWNKDNLTTSIHQFCDMAHRVFSNTEPYLENQYLHAFMIVSRHSPNYLRVREPSLENDAADCIAMLFRGTFDYLLLCIRYYLGGTSDPTFKKRLAKTIAIEMTNVIERMRKDAIDMLENPRDIPPPKDSGDWDDKDFVQEATYTWGKVSRNAHCPCGSGKRYKHCHGANA